MLFSIEHTRRADEPVTAAEIYARAEQRGLLIGDTGVCAGPRHMIEEFLAAVVDGAPPERVAGLELPGDVDALLSELPAAIDYALHGLQVWSVSLPVWLAMSRAYEALLAIFETAADDRSARLRARLRADWAVLERVQITFDDGRDVHLRAYVNAYEQAWRALRTPIGRPTHAQEIAPVAETAVHRAAASQLLDILATRMSCSELVVDALVDTVVRYLRVEQAILATTAAHLEAVNALLERPRAHRPLQVLDLRLYYMLGRDAVFPYLLDALDDELGVRVECTASSIHVIDRRAGSAAP
jgi:hypothetical protein